MCPPLPFNFNSVVVMIQYGQDGIQANKLLLRLKILTYLLPDAHTIELDKTAIIFFRDKKMHPGTPTTVLEWTEIATNFVAQQKGRVDMKRILAMVISLALVFSLLLCASAASLLPAAEGSPITVVSFNVLVGGSGINTTANRIPRVVSCINTYKPDSFGVQEADYAWMTGLSSNLTDYAYVGVGRDNGTNNSTSGETSAIFYLKNKYSVASSGTFWLSTTPSTPSIGWDAAYKRICTWAVLRNKQTGEQYVHVNTHLDHVGTEARREGVKLVLEKINSFYLPVVCTGDFNADETNEVYSLMTAGKMKDSRYLAAHVVNAGGTLHNFGTVDTSQTLPIDFCFASADDLEVNTYRVIKDTVNGYYPSDHYGILMQGNLRKNTASYRAAFGTPVVDGVRDVIYDRAQVVSVGVDSNSAPVTSGATAVVRTVYDNNYIYCLAEVTDSTTNSATTIPYDTNYGIDGVQFFFDFLNTDSATTSPSAYSFVTNESGYIIADLAGTNINRQDGGTQPRSFGGFAGYWGDPGKTDYKIQRTSTGYNIELKLALGPSLINKLAAGQTDIPIGIGFQVNDDTNNDGQRNSLCFNTGAINSAWSSPVYMNTVVLSSGTYRAAQGTAVLDGIADSAYQSAEAIYVDRNSAGAYETGAASAVVHTLYDSHYLYCIAEVTDSTVNSSTTRPADTNYGLDGVQFFFDFLNTDTASSTAASYPFVSGESGYVIADLVASDHLRADGTAIVRSHQGFSSYWWNLSKLDYRAVQTGQGYNIELRIALSDSVKTRLANQEANIRIGAGFQVNDDTDDDGVREQLSLSNGLINSAWVSPWALDSILLNG